MKKTLFLLLAIAPVALAADVTGRFPAGEKYEEPAAHAPAHVSRMFARSVPRAAASAIDIPAAGGSGMIIWTIPSRPAAVSTRLVTPTGAVLQPGDRGSLERGLRRFKIDSTETAELGLPGGAHEVVHVADAAAAMYQLRVDVPDAIEGVTLVVAEPESRITLSSWAAPLSRQPGDPVTLHAELRDGDAPLAGARVTARLAAPNGRKFDAIALVETTPGVYRATFANLPIDAPGAWQVRFEAEGTTQNGTRFARTGSGELMSERGAARLGRIATVIAGDALRVTVPVDVAIAGNYRYDVFIADRSRNALAWGEAVRMLHDGATELEIDIPLAHLGNTRVEDLFIDARLLSLDTIGVAGRVTTN
ncbi:MAG TPA: FixH family protein [Thermoanaerobaculia bacterium]